MSKELREVYSRINSLQYRIELLEDKNNAQIRCEKCGCLLYKPRAKVVEDKTVYIGSYAQVNVPLGYSYEPTTQLGSITLYYCQKCAPSYDMIELEDGVKKYYKNRIEVDVKC